MPIINVILSITVSGVLILLLCVQVRWISLSEVIVKSSIIDGKVINNADPATIQCLQAILFDLKRPEDIRLEAFSLLAQMLYGTEALNRLGCGVLASEPIKNKVFRSALYIASYEKQYQLMTAYERQLVENACMAVLLDNSLSDFYKLGALDGLTWFNLSGATIRTLEWTMRNASWMYLRIQAYQLLTNQSVLPGQEVYNSSLDGVGKADDLQRISPTRE